MIRKAAEHVNMLLLVLSIIDLFGYPATQYYLSEESQITHCIGALFTPKAISGMDCESSIKLDTELSPQ